jgi:cell division protein FtsQ
MWDKPALLNRVSDLLLLAALCGVLYGLAAWAMRLPAFAITAVHITTPLVHVTPEQVRAIVHGEIRGTLFTLQPAGTRAAFEKLPWVRRAEIRRQWPGTIEVRLHEHAPLARWGKTALVNLQGEVFVAAYDGELPVFNGPAGTAKEITIQYRHFRASLEPIGRHPGEISLTPRRAWQLRLDDGMTLDLGRDQVEQRLRRFVELYPRTIARMARPVDRVDLRYANGFAARVPGLAPVADARAKRGV